MNTTIEPGRHFEHRLSANRRTGKLKPYMVPDWRGGAELALMRMIKGAIDPRGLMNPCKVLP